MTFDLFTNAPQPVVKRPMGESAGDVVARAAPGESAAAAVPFPAAPIESSAEQAANNVGTVRGAERADTRTPPARAAGLDDELPEDPLVPITEDQWARILDGRKVRWLVKPVHIEWAGKRAVSCGNCSHTKMHGDPRRGWCTEHRFLVSLAFTLLCREHKPS